MKSTTEDTEGTESDTPETDKAFKYWPSENAELVDANFARKLERERDEARRIPKPVEGGQMSETKEIRKLRKLLADANRGAEINAHINNSLTKKLQERTAERDEAQEQLVRSNHFLHQAEENLESIYRERDKAREMQSEFKRIIAGLCDEKLRLVFENRRLSQERDEARREVDRYREEKDLSPMSWDT